VGATVLAWSMALLAPVSVTTTDLIGRVMPPYPGGLDELGGSCVTGSTDAAHVCDYSVGVLATPAADPAGEPVPRFVVAGQLAGRDGPRAQWRITDAQPYPAGRSDYYLQFGTCRVNGQDDARVAALVRQHGTTTEWVKDVAWAGRLRLPDARFDVLDARTVDCINEAYYGL
jgi:hypothetical protein